MLSFEDATIGPLENLIRDTIAQNPDPRLKEFRIRKKDKPSKISATLKYALLPHAMSFDANRFKPDIVAKDAPMGETKISPEAEECLKVTSTLSENKDGNEFSVEFGLSSSLQSAVYLYEVTLRPGIDTYRAPDWCSNWDMKGERDGSKTLNLVNFVRDLSQVTARMHRPKIATFHCYIEKR